jgi:hypothetical protein
VGGSVGSIRGSASTRKRAGRVKGCRTKQGQKAPRVKAFRPYEDTLEACARRGVTVIPP